MNSPNKNTRSINQEASLICPGAKLLRGSKSPTTETRISFHFVTAPSFLNQNVLAQNLFKFS